MSKILYISYDGMTDPLGQSQVINYLIGLRKFGFHFDILSFEKPEKYKLHNEYIQSLLTQNNIGWYPQIFHNSPPIFSKLYDRNKLKRVAKRLHRKNSYSLIHCRSYIAAEIGLLLKRSCQVKFLFDMRGFWADEKAEGNSWNRSKWFWNQVYLFYKRKEQEFIQEADHIISLTEAAKNEIEMWSCYTNKAISVIPCCANLTHFSLTDSIKRENAKEKIGVDNDSFVLSYLGSLGTWYMFDEMLTFYTCLLKYKANAVFLVLTNSNLSFVRKKIEDHGLDLERFRLYQVPYIDVPDYMYASDLSLSFIRPVYSKKSSSPVKIGELMGMGIPIIMSNIGDAEHLSEVMVVHNFSNLEYHRILKVFFSDESKSFNKNSIRSVAENKFSLGSGIRSYLSVYNSLFKI